MEIAPRTSRVAVLRDPTRGPSIAQFAVIQAMAPARAVEQMPVSVCGQRASCQRSRGRR
jgi:putative tryptophan/tyrosine transport system substrate-binding protein